MPVVLLGLGYLLLAAAGAACWGLVLAGSLCSDRPTRPATRTTSLLVAAGLALLAARWVLVVLLTQADAGFAQEKAVIGLPISTFASLLAAGVWWMPPRGAAASSRKDALTTGAFAGAAIAAGAEIILTVVVGAPAGPAAAVAVVA